MDLQSKIDDLDEDIKKHSEDLKVYFEQLKDAYIKHDTKALFDMYKYQLNALKRPVLTANEIDSQVQQPSSTSTQKGSLLNINKNSSAPLQTISFAPFQCLIGVLEVLIEYFVSCKSYK